MASVLDSLVPGETVTKDEQINLLESEEMISATQSMMSLSTVATSVLSPATSVVTALTTVNPLGSADVRPLNADEWEKERTALFQELDEKVTEKRTASHAEQTG